MITAELLSDIVDQAIKRGATDAEAIGVEATEFEVEVYQGSDLRDVTKNELIGTIPVRDIPPRAKADVNIDILFRLDKNNICTVKVTVTGPDFDPIVIEKGLHQ